jgi:hypothetical protein
MRGIGPTGEFSLGKPSRPDDQGGLNVSLSVVRTPVKLVVMKFGCVVTWVSAPPAEIQTIATAMRRMVIRNFGRMLLYDKSTLPIGVVANREANTIELHLPKPAYVLAANPEMWLALAEVIEDRIKELQNDPERT